MLVKVASTKSDMISVDRRKPTGTVVRPGSKPGVRGESTRNAVMSNGLWWATPDVLGERGGRRQEGVQHTRERVSTCFLWCLWSCVQILLPH